ncbi:MAG: Hsp20/alpha crystallin family protein [Pelobium sp.]
MTLVKFKENRPSTNYNTFNELFDSYLKEGFVNDKSIFKVPAVNISESVDHFHIELAAPGLKKEDFKIALDKDVLIISSEKKSENSTENLKINRKEFNYSTFTRSFNLPDLVDYANIDATYIDGILKIDIAKKEEAKLQTREIAVK